MRNINQMEPWIGQEERDAMVAYLDSGGWLTEYKKSREFEELLEIYTSARHATVVNNGTISLVIALMALGVGRNDEVIVPDFTMIASANAVVLSGAIPVLVDVDESSLCLDIDLVEKAITRKTKAIMFVSINGRCGLLKDIVSLAEKYGLFLIEDSAQSLGSRCDGRHLGTFGEIGSFSFSHPKIITTGQGGALVTGNRRLYERIARIKDFGRPKSGIDYHEILGLNSKFTDIQAVIGIEQMKKLPQRVMRKKEMFRVYSDLLRNVDGIHLLETNLDDCTPWFIDILVRNGNVRRALCSFLRDRGIGTRPFYPAIHTQPPYSGIVGEFQVAKGISDRGVWLPSSSFLSDEDIGWICNNIREFYAEKRDVANAYQ